MFFNVFLFCLKGYSETLMGISVAINLLEKVDLSKKVRTL